jgi:antitoxin (DNA-binding transcriptional repressor) of toxin-antitoxin stability system
LTKGGYCGYYMVMVSVGVRDLKNQLSQYLQIVKNGEKVLITEHNKIIAEISLPEEGQGPSEIEESLKKLISMGKLLKAKRNSTLGKLQKNKVKIDWESIYQDTRAER